ncbi:EAL domain-containing protein [Marinobacter daepoensis]|uniref:EAL domain-containing protein n=1 Tax=Marinobacter daepoensis TaxID=262077 RepID=UPI0004244F6E|nr:EAL domain-containing protein [Marinobacter daepoensis]
MATILIVDDHEPNRELVASLAGYLGHNILEAPDGEQALAVVRKHRPDLVICDLLMPVMDGYDFVRQVRQTPDIAETEIMFYTANYREDEARTLANQLGVKRIIFKPCVPEDVLEAIGSALRPEETAPAPPVDENRFEAEHTRILTDTLSRKSDELEKANRRLAALTEINLQLSGMRDAGRMLETICRDARALVGACYGILCVNENHNGGQQIRLFLSGFSPDSKQGLACPDFDGGLPGVVLRDKTTKRLHAAGQHNLRIGLPEGYPPVRACVISPIMSATEVYGWVCLVNRLDDQPFTEEDEWLCSSHAAMAGRVYENRSLYLQLESRARKLQLYDRAIEESSNGIVICLADKTRDNPVIYANRAFSLMTGYTHDEILGMSPRFLLANDHEQPGLDRLRNCMRHGGSARAILRNYRKDGSLFWNEVALAAVHNDQGDVAHFISVFNDVTDRKRYEAALEYQANHDDLTGLPNRNLLRDRLDHAIAQANREKTNLAVLLLDLDQFKRVNDGLGHAIGDRLIQRVAARMIQCVRESDTVARLGGDEFMILSTNVRNEHSAVALAQKLLRQFERKIVIKGHEIVASASIGIAIYPKDGESGDELFRNADTAMYRAKDLGRNGFQFYSADMNNRMRERLYLEQSLRNAISRHELSLWYQPKLDLSSNTIRSTEALIRWRHPQLGMISPTDFIPIAEDTGLILPIGAWIIEDATRQISEWRDKEDQNIRVAINISAHQFGHQRLSEQIIQALESLQLPPRLLTLEVTETALMTHMEAAVRQLQALRDIGVCVALDDFGTGYSSLTYLKHFPIDVLKIDRSFVADIAHDTESGAIVRTIITLAHSLNMTVVAEGVETQAQLAFLKENGCDEIQGYLFCKPLPAGEFLEFLRHHR